MTELADKTEAEQTITIGEKTYPVAGLSDQVKEMLSLHQQASEMVQRYRSSGHRSSAQRKVWPDSGEHRLRIWSTGRD